MTKNAQIYDRPWLLVALGCLTMACTAGIDPLPAVESVPARAAPALCDYPQAFGTADHAGLPCPELHGMRVAAKIVQDDLADEENEDSGFLQVHESPPLTSGDFVVIGHKSGFVSGYDVRGYRWVPSVDAPNAVLSPIWEVPTDWQPVDGVVGSHFYVTSGYVAMFAPAIRGNVVFVPAAAGRLLKLDLRTGSTIATIDPLVGTAFSGDSRTIVNSAVSVDRQGNVYDTVVAWPLGAFPSIGTPPRGAWLVRVSPEDQVTLVDWSTIASSTVGVPQASDLCEYPFGTLGTPGPTGPDSRPPLFGCGPQRPAMNAPVAIDPHTGHLVVYSYAHNAQGAAFLIEVDPSTMLPISASDTRGHLLHGCGVRLLGFDVCDVITDHGKTNVGNDPSFNGPVRFRGPDLMDSAPSIAPNGARAICGYDGGFSFGGGYDARGACVLFDESGSFKAVNQEFGWEVTASAWPHDGGFSYLQDRQLYSDLVLGMGQYGVTGSLEMTDGIPLDLDPVAIDFLDAHVPFGSTGDRYGINGDGHLYKFSPDNSLPVDSVELTNDDGSIRSMEGLSGYFARDRTGRILASYAGFVWVIESTGLTTSQIRQQILPEGAARLRAGIRAKQEAAVRAKLPGPPG
jgi:hypothetical protein